MIDEGVSDRKVNGLSAFDTVVSSTYINISEVYAMKIKLVLENNHVGKVSIVN